MRDGEIGVDCEIRRYHFEIIPSASGTLLVALRRRHDEIKLRRQRSPRLLPRSFGTAVAGVMAVLVPRRKRMAAALSLVRASSFIRFGARGITANSVLDGVREIRLARLMYALTRYGCEFDLDADVKGRDAVLEAMERSGGLILVGAHATLNLFVLRLFHDLGHRVLVVAADAELLVPGTHEFVETIPPDRNSFVRLWHGLQRHRIVGAMTDTIGGNPAAKVQMDLGRGVIGFHDALFRFAIRSRKPVAFTDVHVNDLNRMEITLQLAPDGPPERLLDAFIAFTQAHADEQRNPTSRDDVVSSTNPKIIPSCRQMHVRQTP